MMIIVYRRENNVETYATGVNNCIYCIRGNFRQFRHLLSLVKFLYENFLSCINDYIEDMVTFTALAKIYSTEYFCTTKVAGIGEKFVK